MPYKKGGEAYKRSLERKKAKRRIARLEKEISKTGSEKERVFYEQQVRSLREQVSKTYEFNPLTHKATGYTKDDIRMAARNLTRMNVSSEIGRTSQSRKNFITQQELNTAKSYHSGIQSIGEFTSEEVRIFYRATQEAWQGLSSKEDRNKTILEYYGRSDLRDFVREVLDMNKEAVERSKRDYREPVSDGEMLDTDGESDRQASAEFLSYVVSPSQYDAMKSYIQEPSFDILEIPSFE